jgi:hypothetical protein
MWKPLVDGTVLVYGTDDYRLSNGAFRGLAPSPLDTQYFGPEAVNTVMQWAPITLKALRSHWPRSARGW